MAVDEALSVDGVEVVVTVVVPVAGAVVGAAVAIAAGAAAGTLTVGACEAGPGAGPGAGVFVLASSGIAIHCIAERLPSIINPPGGTLLHSLMPGLRGGISILYSGGTSLVAENLVSEGGRRPSVIIILLCLLNAFGLGGGTGGKCRSRKAANRSVSDGRTNTESYAIRFPVLSMYLAGAGGGDDGGEGSSLGSSESEWEEAAMALGAV